MEDLLETRDRMLEPSVPCNTDPIASVTPTQDGRDCKSLSQEDFVLPLYGDS